MGIAFEEVHHICMSFREYRGLGLDLRPHTSLVACWFDLLRFMCYPCFSCLVAL